MDPATGIRRTLEYTIGDLVEGLAMRGAFDERGIRRVLEALEPGTHLLHPPPQLFGAIELQDELAEASTVRVPVRTSTGQDLVVTARIRLVTTTHGEMWRGELLTVEPRAESDPELDALQARTAGLIEASAARRAAEAQAVPPPPPAPAPPANADASAAAHRAAEALAGGDDRLRDMLPGHARPSIRLRPCGPAEARSRFGGVPYLRAGTEWPRRASRRPLHFLAQIDLREVPRIAGLPALPPEGTLAFFYDCECMPWGIEPADADAFAVLFVPPGEELARVTPPSDTADGFVQPVAGIRPEVEATLDPYALPLSEEDQDVIAERLEESPIHRLLGEPDGIQGDPREHVLNGMRGDDWELLLQIDSGEPLGLEFGDNGRIYFLVKPGDLAELRFDLAWLILECY